MKRKEIEAYLESRGFYFLRDSKHCVFSNGKVSITIPHHKEINPFLAKKIKRQADNACVFNTFERKAA